MLDVNTRTLVPYLDNKHVHYVDALGAVQVAGYTFLLHRCFDRPDRFTATYAPVGLGIGPYNTIDAVISALTVQLNRFPDGVSKAIASMESRHHPLLAPEEGIIKDDWQWREQCRFDSGEYKRVPQVLDLEYPAKHYVHLSVTKTESDFVAYTPSESYGECDRQVRLKFGKYLRKAFSHLSDADIQRAVTKLRAQLALAESPDTLHFATDRATINEIFETAMCACDSDSVSCMHGKWDGQAIRPYHVYADSPDVAVAYLREHGEITARTVVSTKDKEWIRLYAVDGCSTKCRVLEDLLTQAGYTEGDLEGNRLTKLDTFEVMLPYIDCGGKQVISAGYGKYWRVVRDGEGEYEASCTDGTAEYVAHKCPRCDCDEDSCECVYCECCEESYYPHCERCSMCPRCDSCVTHENCDCSRCHECGQLTERRQFNCECERCSDCNELESECECEEPEEPEESTGATA